MRKRAIVYARVSTDEQAEHGYSLQSQLEGNRKYCSGQGFEVVAEITDDCSGTIPVAERPGGRQIYQALRRKEVDIIVLYTIDRTSRDKRDYPIEFLIFLRDVQDFGAELHFVDTGKSEGSILDLFRAWQAGEERRKIRERCMRGIRAKVASGKWAGTGHPYGYRREGRNRDARLLIDEVEAAIVRRVFDMYIGRNGYDPTPARTIATILNAEGVVSPGRGQRGGHGWYGSMITELLSHRNYLGEFPHGGQIVYLPDLALVDGEAFELAGRKRAENKAKAKRNRKRDYLLVGHIGCICGCAMCGMATVGNARELWYYRCQSKRRGSSFQRKCNERHVRADIADVIVWDWLSGLIKEPEKMRAGLEQRAARRGEELKPKLERLAQVKKLIDRTNRSLKLLAQDLRDLKGEGSREAVKTEMENASVLLSNLIDERNLLAADVEEGELTPERQEEIMAQMAEIRQGIEDGDVAYATKRRLLDMFDVQIKVEYRNEVRGLFMQWVLKYGEAWKPLSLEKDCLKANAQAWAARCERAQRCGRLF